tara:strand:+ start:315 stop:554 length:240 start_codon:yes stop_codon:yes gene_type:complete
MTDKTIFALGALLLALVGLVVSCATPPTRGECFDAGCKAAYNGKAASPMAAGCDLERRAYNDGYWECDSWDTGWWDTGY